MSFIFLLNFFYNKKENDKLKKKFVSEKIKYLEKNVNIALINKNKSKINILLKKFKDTFPSKKYQIKQNNLIKIFRNYEEFVFKINSSLPKNFTKKFEVFIFSNNFLGKSLKKFIQNNNQKVKYTFDDNLKFQLTELEKFNFKKNILNIFYIAITDKKIFNKIKRRIYNLKLNKNLIKIIELF